MWTALRTAADQGRRATQVAAAALVLTGATCVGVGATHQRRPEPPLSAVETTVSATTTRPLSTMPQTGGAATGPVLPASTPVLLAIPAIGVRTRLIRLGLSRQGALETPPPGPHYDEAGWYRYSPTPGSLGPAVIAGHVDSAANGPSVFFRLVDLRPQDRVLVTRVDGSVAVFAVDNVLRYRKTGFPSALVYGNTHRAALRLITCGGRFDHASGHYLDNIIVLASLVDTTHVGPAARRRA